MRFHHKLFTGTLLLAGLLSMAFNTAAQDFALQTSASPNPVPVNSTLTYTINITNTSGFDRFNVSVTNLFSADVSYIGATSFLINAVSTDTNKVIFQLGTFPAGFVEQIVMNIVPLSAGSLNNQITIVAPSQPSVATNVATQVNSPNADLGISLTNAVSGILAGDTTTIGLNVTNHGTIAASGVVVSNILPASFELLSVTPTNTSPAFTNGNLVVNVGTLAGGSSTQLLVLVRPTNGGSFNIAASVFSTNLADLNPANNAVTNSMIVDAVISTNLSISVISAQQFNPQTGLMEEVVRVINNGTNTVDAVRLIVGGLMTNRLYNAVGTNNGDPFVLYAAPLAPAQPVDLLLEYFVRSRQALTNLTHTAIGVTMPSVTVPTNTVTPIQPKAMTASGFLIEFQSIPGRSYTIVYADDASFTNARVAQPIVVAPADRTQWLDYGPPKTIAAPASVTSRFYRVLLNP